jgi:cytochrome-b5 reductase
MAEPADRQISMEELQSHRASGDLWLLIEGKVYDVSVYMEEHPGGANLLLDSATDNNDSSEDYENAEHSRKAKKKLEEFWIGCLSN